MSSPTPTVLAVLGFPGDLSQAIDRPLHEFFSGLEITVLHDADLTSLYARMGEALASGANLVAVAADTDDPLRKNFIPALAQSYPLVLLHEGSAIIEVEQSMALPCGVQEVLQVLGVDERSSQVIGPTAQEDEEDEEDEVVLPALPALVPAAQEEEEDEEEVVFDAQEEDEEDEEDARALVAREVERARLEAERLEAEKASREELAEAERAREEAEAEHARAEAARAAAARAAAAEAARAQRLEEEAEAERAREEARRVEAARTQREIERADRARAADAFSGEEDPETKETFGIERGKGGLTQSYDPFQDENPEVVSDGPVFGTERMRNAGVPIIVVGSGKGGVGKSTLSCQLARVAGELSFQAHARDEEAGLAVKRRRKKKIVLLIDANSGQADLMKIMGVNERRHAFPTISRLLSGADPRSVIISSESLSKMRNRNSPNPFAVVAGPTKTDPLGTRVRPRHYMDMITWAQSKVDLIVVDTQILEAHYPERDNFYDRLVVPLLMAGAWFVGVTDPSDTGLDNLIDRLDKLNREGVAKGKMLSVVNAMHPDAVATTERVLPEILNRVSSFVGVIRDDPRILAAGNNGETDLGGSDAMDLVLRRILFRVTADTEYDPTALEEAAAAGSSAAGGRGAGLLSRLMGRRK